MPLSGSRPTDHFMKKTLIALLSFFVFAGNAIHAQTDYSSYFQEAYNRFPSIPEGMLESIAWTNTHMTHVQPQKKSCSAKLPDYYGVMGLVKLNDSIFSSGFKSTLDTVVKYAAPDFSRDQIINDPRSNILAYAKTFAREQQNKRLASRSNLSAYKDVVSTLSEIPNSGDLIDEFAHDQQYYAVLKQIENPSYPTGQTARRIAPQIDYEEIFGENLRVVSASQVTMSRNRVSGDGHAYRVQSSGATERSAAACDQNAGYFGSIWVAADPNNYREGRDGNEVEFIAIHTIQGSYASAISWFKNRAARVSAHYIVRSFDGQITQMVCENDKAIHVKGRNSKSQITYNSSAVGIEHEGYIDDGATWYSTPMYESSAALVRDLCKRHGIDPKRTFSGKSTQGVNFLGDQCTKIKGHQHFSGNNHTDPGQYWDWDRYYRLINGEPKPQELTDKSGTIYDSGGAGKNYGDMERTAWWIKPKNATQLELTFDALDTEAGYDIIEIYDGDNRNGVLLGKFSGNALPKPNKLVAKTGRAYIEFQSDCQFNHEGWKISYSSDKKKEDCGSPANLMVEDKSLTALTATLSWDKVDKADYYQLYLIRRNIPGGKALLFKPQNNKITITGLAADAPYQWQLEAVCGTAKDTSARVGHNFQTPVISRKGQAKQYIVSLNAGRFYDTGGREADYSDQEEYSYTIKPPNGGRVQMKFSSFETEDGLDVLSIYDGENDRSKLLGKYSGNKNPGTVTSSGNAMTLVFTSDKRTMAPGWAAQWNTIGGNNTSDDGQVTVVIDNSGNTSGGTTGGDPTNNGNNTPPPVNVSLPSKAFKPNLVFTNKSPLSTPSLKNSYDKSFNVGFNDRDRNGRGLANRFYSVATYTPQGFRGVTEKGFLFDDFSGSSLHPDWKAVAGSWEVRDGRLAQLNANEGNSNLYAEVAQDADHTYIYHWIGRVSGTSTNKRFGLHFFCSDPQKEDRGDSYFVWIRDTDEGDKIEIYEVRNDEFTMRADQRVTLNENEAYDFKVVYNPRKGRMEVYMDNAFRVAWTDPKPIKTGKAISLRTGGCVAEYDDIQIFQNRQQSVTITVGPNEPNTVRVESPDKRTDAVRISTLVVGWGDRLLWSPVSAEGAKIFFSADSGTIANSGGGTSSGGNTSGNTGGSSGGNTGTSTGGNTGGSTTSGGSSGSTSGSSGSANSGASRGGETNKAKAALNGAASSKVWLGSSYSHDFIIDFPPRDGVDQRFVLASDYDGANWTANDQQGFLHDNFGKIEKGWKQEVGKWEINLFGNLRQSDPEATNGNLHHRLLQTGNTSYLYNFDARILSTGDNKRFGFHFFCSDASKPNRGDSYFVWFRKNDSEADKVEIYRSSDDVIDKKRSATIDLKTDIWYDVKILYDAVLGKIEIYLNNEIALAWQDPLIPLKSGHYVSFRTGSAEVLFDDLKVYRSYSDRFTIKVGNQATDMWRYKGKARVYTLEQARSDSWYLPSYRETVVK